MKRSFLRAAMVALSLLMPLGASAQKLQTQTVYVHVTDAGGDLIKDLSPSDFVVNQGGAPAKVVRATFGSDPIRVLFLVDSSDAISKIINQFRAGLQALIDGVPVRDEIALVSMGRQLRIRAQPTTDRKKVKDEAGRLFSDGGGTVLLDSLVEAYDRLLAKVDNREPVIVILTTDGAETSTGVREEQFNQFVSNLVNRGVVVHAVVLQTGTNITGGAQGGVGAGPSSGTQSIVAMNLTQNTGGYMESIGAPTALADKMKAIAAEITTERETLDSWYRVDFQVEAGARKLIDVEVRRPDVKMQLSSGLPGASTSLRSIK